MALNYLLNAYNIPYAFCEQIGTEIRDISDEIPFDIPESWEWIRLNDIGIYRKGPFGSSLTKSMFVPKEVDTVKVYEQKNAIKKDHTLGNYYITRKYYNEKMQGFTVSAGDIIVSCAGTIGETYVMPDDIELGIINQALMRMTIFAPMDIDFFLMYFDYVLKNSAKESSKGSAIKNIPPFEIFKQLLLPLPPLPEQHRIVAKIEELLPYIEKYEQAETELTKLNRNFPEQLKKSILQDAVQGKLVPQDPNDEPASVLLERIRKEKQTLIKAGKIKKDKHESVIVTSDKIPYEIPDSWVWTRFLSIMELQSGQDLTPDKYNSESRGLPYITGASNIENNAVIINRWTEYGKAFAYSGDILLTCKGTIGTMAILQQDKVHIARQIMAIRPYKGIDVAYVKLVLESLVERLKSAAKSMIPGIARDDVLLSFIPIPPLSEQKRIVAKISDLMSIINTLSL